MELNASSNVPLSHHAKVAKKKRKKERKKEKRWGRGDFLSLSSFKSLVAF